MRGNKIRPKAADFQVGDTVVEAIHYLGISKEFIYKVIRVTKGFIFLSNGKKVSRKPVVIGGTEYFFESGNNVKFSRA